MSFAGYKTRVKITGDGTAMTSEAMSTFSTAANTFRIDDKTKEVWDRNASFTFTESGSTISSTDISEISYLFGYVTFNSTKNSTGVAVSGTYLPTSDVSGANDYSLSVNQTLLDETAFATSTDPDGYVQRKPGLRDASLTITRFDNVSTDFFEHIKNSTKPLVIEINPGGSSDQAIRGFFKVESENRSGSPSDLESADISLSLDDLPTKANLEFNTLQ